MALRLVRLLKERGDLVISGVSLAVGFLLPMALLILQGERLPGLIAFTAPGRNYAVYLVRPDGSELRNLTVNALSESNPVWSPDGKRIALVASGRFYGVHVVNIDGSGALSVNKLLGSSQTSAAAWSPDGSQLAIGVTGNPPNESGIYILQADGSDLRRVAPATRPLSLTWSPDGSRIAIVNQDSISGKDSCGFGGAGTTLNIYILNLANSQMMRVTDNGNSYFPAWSPDGQKIAFYKLSRSKRYGREWPECKAADAKRALGL